MSDVDERLVVMLEARISEFEKRMGQAERTGTRTYQKIQAESRRLRDRMATDAEAGAGGLNRALASVSSNIGTFGKAFVGGLAVGVVTSVLSQISTDVRGLIGDIGDLNDAAGRLGVSTDDLQSLQYGFKLQGVEVSETTSALEKFVDGIGEAAQGGGALKDVFDRAGISLKDQNGQLKDTGTLLREFADLVEKTSSAAGKMALVTDAFGRGGKAMVGAMEGGSAALDRMVTDAKDAGVVLDAELVQKAAVLDDKFDILTAKAGTFFKTIVVEAAAATGMVQDLGDALPSLSSGGQAANMIGQPVADALAADPAAADAAAAQLAEISAAYDDLTFAVTQASRAISDEIPYLVEIGDTGAAMALADITGEMDDLTGKVAAGLIPTQEYADKMAELTTKARAAMTEAQSIDNVDLSNALSGIDRITSALSRVFDMAQAAVNKIGELAGVTPGALVGSPERTDMPGMRGRGIGAWNGQGPMTSPRPQARPTDIDFGVPDPVRRGGGGGGGGGGQSAAVSALVSDLQTERQAVEAWYSESQALLSKATDAQLETIGGRHTAIERLEAEHQRRLMSIQGDGQGGMLSNVQGFMGAMATLAQAGGDKTLKAYRIFAAAEGLINVSRAQLQVLADPRLGLAAKFSALAAVGAAGAGLVSAIQSGGKASAAGGGGSIGDTGGGAALGGGGRGGPVELRIIADGVDPKALYSGQVLIDLTRAIQAELKLAGF